MINALIIAPEITKGMKSIGSKSLLEIKKKLSILEYQINHLFTIDPHITITVATGFDSDRIVDLINTSFKNKINYIYNKLYTTTNQAASLRIFLDIAQNKDIDNLFIMTSGVLLKNAAISKNELAGSSKIFVLNKDKENFELGCSAANNHAEYIFYDLPKVWSECVYLNKEAICKLKHIIDTKQIDQMYLFETINALIHNNIIIATHNIDKKKIMKINNQKDLTKARLFI